MECAPVRAQAWLDDHESRLGSLPLDDIVAMIEQAGLEPRVVASGCGGSADEQRPDRVTVWLTPAGEPSSVDAG